MSTSAPLYIYDLDLDDLTRWVVAQGEKPFRARQIWEGLYRHLWDRPEAFTTLPKALRQRMEEAFTFHHLTPVREVASTDGETHKTLFHLPDGSPVETVRMRYVKRRTLCISTQSGCAMGCTFCATGQMGLRRNLSPGEIVEQVLYYARWLRARGDRVTNIVVMGMGEPFHNYQATMRALARLTDPQGFGLGQRRITVSTVGLVPRIRDFARSGRQYNLAISLHAADDDLRSQMLPINRKYPLAALMEAVREYIALTHRRVTFEWALIQGVNDTPEQARQLAHLLRGVLAHVNLIPLNPTTGFAGQASSRKRIEAFRAILEQQGVPCTVRLRRGIDIQAGCGQLAGQETSPLDPGFVLKSI